MRHHALLDLPARTYGIDHARAAEASNGAKLDLWYDRLNVRPYANTLLIRVGRGYLHAGDTLSIRLGDRRRYLRVTQADGHQAWSSPIYLIA